MKFEMRILIYGRNGKSSVSVVPADRQTGDVPKQCVHIL